MLEFELLVVACFPKRIPQSLLNQGDVAPLNIHPSLLPQYRGPAPLFWQLRDGMREIGVTLHHVTSQIDGGDIVTQTKVALPTGISGSAADELLASAGTDMLLDTIQSGDYSGRSQSGPESYHSWPRVLDWNVPTYWKVLHAFNFMRGVSEWGQSFKLLAYPKTLTARYASDFTRGKSSPGTVRVSKVGGQEVGFADGWLHIC
jgi:methionyl-tRNA formyltransferase